ncbi:hypothetical protein [Streptomyces sp. NPDC003832]
MTKFMLRGGSVITAEIASYYTSANGVLMVHLWVIGALRPLSARADDVLLVA